MADDARNHALALAEELLEDIEMTRTTVPQQVMKASRLARLLHDDDAARWLRYELQGVPNDANGREHMTEMRRWTDQSKGTGWWVPISDLASMVETFKSQLAASQIGSLSGDMLIPVTRENRDHQGRIALNIQKLLLVLNGVQSKLHDFAARAYHELVFSEQQRRLFDNARLQIDGLLAPAVGDALSKIDSIYQRLSEGDTEAISQAMVTCRRLIESFANAVFPAQPDPVVIDGNELQVGDQNTLNRIAAFVALHLESKSRRDRIRRTLRDIYSRVSAGVHDGVSLGEARYLFLLTYIVLGEVLDLRG
jgi:hypothetical protein